MGLVSHVEWSRDSDESVVDWALTGQSNSLRNFPCYWRDKPVCRKHGSGARRPRTAARITRSRGHPKGKAWTAPYQRPIKGVYIRKVVRFIEAVGAVRFPIRTETPRQIGDDSANGAAPPFFIRLPLDRAKLMR